MYFILYSIIVFNYTSDNTTYTCLCVCLLLSSIFLHYNELKVNIIRKYLCHNRKKLLLCHAKKEMSYVTTIVGIPTTISNAYSVSTRMQMCKHHPQNLVDNHRDSV